MLGPPQRGPHGPVAQAKAWPGKQKTKAEGKEDFSLLIQIQTGSLLLVQTYKPNGHARGFLWVKVVGSPTLGSGDPAPSREGAAEAPAAQQGWVESL